MSTMLERYERFSRRICWPSPDRVCLQGGCTYCNDNEWRKVSEIYKRIKGSEDLKSAFAYGAEHNFWNAEFRDDLTGTLIP